MKRKALSVRVGPDAYNFLTTQKEPAGRVIDALVKLALDGNDYEKLLKVNDSLNNFINELRGVQGDGGPRRYDD